MSWERDPLWAKARLFLEYALAQDRDDARFGLWCAIGLELLARAAVSAISPTLLAEPDQEHRHLLHALGRGSPKVGPKSLGAAQVFRLCEILFDHFTPEHSTAAIALINRRNAELHTGQNAFDDYSTQHWITGFYACCKALTKSLNESLASLLGEDEAIEAEKVLAVNEREVKQRVRERVARYQSVFSDKLPNERAAAQTDAEAAGARLSHQRHHRVKCPACLSTATVQGDELGASKVEHDEDKSEIVVKQTIAPRSFSCVACGLKLDGYAELSAAGLGNQYTRTTRYTPEEYYELISPDDWDEIGRIARDRLGLRDPPDPYDNE